MEDADMVKVPRALLRELVSYLGADDKRGAEYVGGVPIDGQGVWVRSKVHAYAALADAYPAGAALLDRLANHAAGGGGIVAVEDLIAQIREEDFSHASTSNREKQVSNELGAITKRAVRELGGRGRPMSHSRLGGRLHYKMPSEIARWWLEVRG